MTSVVPRSSYFYYLQFVPLYLSFTDHYLYKKSSSLMSNHPQKLVRTVLIFSFPVLRNRSLEFDVCRKRDCKSLDYTVS